MQRVSERRRRVGTVASCYSEYFPRTSFHVSFFRPGSIRLCFYLCLCFARSILFRDTDARAVCRPNPFPSNPSPHRGATSARRVAPAVAHISAPFPLAPNPPRLGPGGPNVRRGAAQSSCRSARPEVGADAHSFSRRAGYGAFSPRRPISTLVLFPRVFLALHVCLV